jgi:mRNA-degrading endonuclease RelE of RelBE toxin-antitoxin system
MNYRLLIDYEALGFLAQLKKPAQRLIHQRLREIQDYPSRCSDYQETDPTGRTLHVSICGEYAITYWEDFADRHIKVLEIARADR